jgi:hypothetical protein
MIYLLAATFIKEPVITSIVFLVFFSIGGSIWYLAWKEEI